MIVAMLSLTTIGIGMFYFGYHLERIQSSAMNTLFDDDNYIAETY